MARKLIALDQKEILNRKEIINELIEGKDYMIYRLSSMQMGKKATPELLWNQFEEVLEARFFNEQEDLHIYDFEGTWKASLFQETGTEEYWDETYHIRERGMKEIKVRKYIEYEEEFGQAYVKEMRPVQVIKA